MLRACDAERQPRKCSETSGPRAPLAPPLLNMETAKAAVPFRSLATSASQPGAPAGRNGSRSCWSCFEPVRAWVVSSQRRVVSQRDLLIGSAIGQQAQDFQLTQSEGNARCE